MKNFLPFFFLLLLKVLKDVKDNHGAERNTPVRALAWRPPGAKAGIPPGLNGLGAFSLQFLLGFA